MKDRAVRNEPFYKPDQNIGSGKKDDQNSKQYAYPGNGGQSLHTPVVNIKIRSEPDAEESEEKQCKSKIFHRDGI
jgi:hypothetical protein